MNTLTRANDSMTLSTDTAEHPLTLDDIADTGETPERAKTRDAEEKLAAIAERRFDADNPPPEPEPIATLQGVTVATVGNIVVLGGQAKTAKSQALSALMASSMTTDAADRDFLGWHAPNPEGKAVIYLDCEQSKQQFYRLISGAMKRAGIEKPPPWFQAYTLTGMFPDEVCGILRAVMAVSRSKHGGILYIAVDGFADLLASPNDEEKSNRLVSELMDLAGEFDTAIVGVIHHNAGAAEAVKMRGHLGSQAERKAETLLTCKKDASEAVTLYVARHRHAPLPESQGSRFAWDDDAGMFLSTTSRAESTNAGKAEERWKLVEDAFLDNKGMSHSELTDRIAELEGLKREAAKKRLAVLRKEGFVTVAVTGRYHKGEKA